VSWDAVHQHGISQRLDNADSVDPPGHPDRQTLSGELIDQGHQADTPAVVGLGFNKVEAPDMVLVLRPEPNAGAIVKPPAPTLWLF